MTRYIDADEIIKYFTIYADEEWTSSELEGLLNNAPTIDAVEVVWCKDCKRYKPNQLVPVHPVLGSGIVYENHCIVTFGFVPKENGFCSRGERREP